jgi:hypothetical protein
MSTFLAKCRRIKNLNNQILPLKLIGFKWDTLYRNEAIQCFIQHLQISCINTASALIETCLSWEYSRQRFAGNKVNVAKRHSRFTLNHLLKQLALSEVPIEKLLDADEKIEILRRYPEKIEDVKYVLTRNMFAHGDISHQASNLPRSAPSKGFRYYPGDFFYPSTYLASLLPSNKKELTTYDVNGDEPILEKIAYIHLHKTLRFMKTFTDLTR